MQIDKGRLREFLLRSLDEDIGSGDITSDVLCHTNNAVSGSYVGKERGVVAGLDIVACLFGIVNAQAVFTPHMKDGDAIADGQNIASVSGPVKDLLACERLSLNLLQRLSGIASATRAYVDEVKDIGVSIMDTRKTVPGMRELEKYAVLVGGGKNHRMGLYDQVLVKDNHVEYMAQLGDGLDIEKIRQCVGPGVEIEVETKNLNEVKSLLAGDPPDIIMLDNMGLAEMRDSVEYVRQQDRGIALEASGGIDLQNVRAVAETGVDRISVGAITHSAKALDIGFYM